MSNIARMMQRATAGAGGAGLDVDEVFSTFLYNGSSSTQLITNGIDLSGEGGLTWFKRRNGSGDHQLFDSERTGRYRLEANTADAQADEGATVWNTQSTGFYIGGDGGSQIYNSNGDEYVSWTFRKAPKFFDIVTYTGNSINGTTVNHNLGSVPGMIIVKNISHGSSNWRVYHRGSDSSAPEDYVLLLNGTNERYDSSSFWNDTAPTSTQFTLGGDDDVNDHGDTYVAYLFAHNNSDGGFGPDSDQDVIKCGSYTGNSNSTGPIIDLGFEPQWIVVKRASNTGGWFVIDTMRGWTNGSTNDPFLRFDSSQQEYENPYLQPLATGFQPKTTSSAINYSGDTYIYMAIRRGPLAAPTDATKVFAIDTKNSTGDNKTPLYRSGFPVDLALLLDTDGGDDFPQMHPRLTSTKYLRTNNTAAEQSGSAFTHDFMNGFRTDTSFSADTTRVCHMWKRAPSFFDVCCYTGTGSAMTVNHNLGVVPEMFWVKKRSATDHWLVYHKGLNGGTNPEDYFVSFTNGGGDDAESNLNIFNDTAPTSSVFSLGNYTEVSGSGITYIAYLFATVSGVSKVGSYTGNGSSQNIDCGFSNGARFVLIKRSSNDGDWYVFDSTRGIVSGNDPYLRLNTNASESQSDDLDPLSSGFTVNQSSASVNFNTHTYIFYAVA